MKPTAMEIPAEGKSLLAQVAQPMNIAINLPAIQKTVFQLSVDPPTPRLAHAAKT